MKIYIGKNKRVAKLISFKKLLANMLSSISKSDTDLGRLNDNSGSWVEIKQVDKLKTKQLAVEFTFNPENDDEITSVSIWESPIEINEEKMKRLI